ncbi:MAG: dihydrolipoamide acetyltransferase family protein [Gemmatimonadota bacterium]|nr:dihydrolipoamide acetyltransferase family protein [Gemmatimonadota bacterium]
MPTEIVMPRLGWTMEEGTLVEWLKRNGDPVEAGDIIFTVESDKAINEIESFDSGTLYIPPDAPQPGETLAIGTVLGFLLGPGEEPPALTPASPAVEKDTESSPQQAAPSRPRTDRSQGRKKRSAISPRALRLATELGVDFRTLQGSGRNGRIVERDVRAAASSPSPDMSEVSIRRTIARRLTESHTGTAPVTLSTEADATELVALRAELDVSHVTYNDLFLKLTAVALAEHRDLNASWQDGTVQRHDEIHIGMAVDTRGGLLVPVITDVGARDLPDLARETADLVQKARQGDLKPEHLQGGTFTITNLGTYGIDVFTPIVNLPQCAILGIGRIAPKPAVYEGRVVPRDMVALSLTFDHRVVDGAPAARFLDTVRRHVERPERWHAR